MTAPKSLRLHVALFGRRNTGKSSLMNALTRQNTAIVSDTPGTTTDPVEKPMELQPLGPIVFIDTAGLDDTGALGEMRVEKTRRVFDRAEIGVIVAEAGHWGPYEQQILDELRHRNTPSVVVFNKSDIGAPAPETLRQLAALQTPFVLTAAIRGDGLDALRAAMVHSAPEEFLQAPPLLSDLARAGDCVVLVAPIDMEAPKGRLIMPQVQAIRDLLDHDVICLVVKERELKRALETLRVPPALVVTDSQAFLKVAADTPDSVPMTSFSILFARAKGDLSEFVRGAQAIERLQSGSRVLICEACAHHPIGDDIGRVKIPRWLQQYAGGSLDFCHVQGHDFPADISPYSLVVHCGGCALNRREVLSRIVRCRSAGVPITNYGICIAYTLGVFERALKPFPAAYDCYRDSDNRTHNRRAGTPAPP